MIGWQELIIPLGLLALAGLFGRKWLKNVFKLAFGAKQDFEEVKKEFETAKIANVQKE